ncbi:MAG: TfoX/Sxy family protein [Oscillospiraceae bacterium]
MSSTKEYLNFILEQLSEVEDIEYRQMMGEYIIYYKGKIAMEICDNRLLVKPVKSALELMPNAVFEAPYEGAKEMLLVDNPDDKEFLKHLLNTIYDDLPTPKPRKKKSEKT